MPDDSKELTIHLKLDRSEHKRANAEAKSEIKGLEAEHDRVAKAIGKGASEGAEAHKKAAKETAQAHTTAFQSVKHSAMEAAGEIGRMGTALIGLEGARRGIEAVVESFKASREAAVEATRENMNYKASVQALSGIKGFAGATPEAIKSSLEFSAKTGLPEAEGGAFERTFHSNIGFAQQKGLISKETSEELAIQSAIQGKRMGISPAAMAGLSTGIAGVAPTATAQQGVGRQALIGKMFQGLGDPNTTLPAFAGGLRESMRVGGFKTPEEAAAVQAGVTTQYDSAAAGASGTMEAMRSLQMARSKQTLGAGMEESGHEYVVETLGIKEGDSLQDMLAKLAPDLEKAEKDGKDLIAYLMERGFKRPGQAHALVALYKSRGAIKSRMDMIASAGALGSEATRANEDYLQSPLGRQGRTAALAQQEVVARGEAGVQTEQLIATQEIGAAKEKEDPWHAFKEKTAGFLELGEGSEAYHRGQMMVRAQEEVVKQARAVGAEYRDTGLLIDDFEDEGKARRDINKVAGRIREKSNRDPGEEHLKRIAEGIDKLVAKTFPATTVTPAPVPDGRDVR